MRQTTSRVIKYFTSLIYFFPLVSNLLTTNRYNKNVSLLMVTCVLSFGIGSQTDYYSLYTLGRAHARNRCACFQTSAIYLPCSLLLLLLPLTHQLESFTRRTSFNTYNFQFSTGTFLTLISSIMKCSIFTGYSVTLLQRFKSTL